MLKTFAYLAKADGTVVAVGPAGTVVAAYVDVCSPPQAPRAIRTVRYIRTSVDTIPAPGNLTCLRNMATIVAFPIRGVIEGTAA